MGTLGLAGCGSSGSSASSHTRTGATTTSQTGGSSAQGAVLRAVLASAAAKGERFSFTSDLELPLLGGVTLAGSGRANNAPRSADLALTLKVPGLAGLSAAPQGLTNLPLTILSTGSLVDIRLPPALAGLGVGGGKAWLAVDLKHLGSVANVPELSPLLNEGTADPASYLLAIAGAAEGNVTRVGAATVDGTATTEYRTTLDFSKVKTALPLAGTSVPAMVWIDGSNKVRRFSLSTELDVSGDAIPVTLSVTVTGYGAQAAPTTPSPADTISLNGLITEFQQSGFGSLLG